MDQEFAKQREAETNQQVRAALDERGQFRNTLVAEMQMAAADGQWATHTDRVMYAFDKLAALAREARGGQGPTKIGDTVWIKAEVIAEYPNAFGLKVENAFGSHWHPYICAEQLEAALRGDKVGEKGDKQ